MLNSIEMSGKTVEVAIKNGLKELGCESSDVDIQILEMGSPGLFGMFGKLAKVRLTRKDKEADEFKIDMSSLTLEPEKPAKKEPVKKAEPAKKAEQPKTEAKTEKTGKPEQPKTGAEKEPEQAEEQEKAQPEQPKSSSRRSRSERRPRKERTEKPEQPEEQPAPLPVRPFEAQDESTWTDDAKRAVEFLGNTTHLMGVDVTFSVCQDDEGLQVRMSGDELGVLIGRRGETLDALQYLTSLYVNKDREGYTRVTLDSENYRAKREEALRKLALRMAQRARKSGRKVVMEPMNPYERRILHSALQGNPYVETHSEGEEPNRRVIITLK